MADRRPFIAIIEVDPLKATSAHSKEPPLCGGQGQFINREILAARRDQEPQASEFWNSLGGSVPCQIPCPAWASQM